jgi:hypothetical protein
MTVFGFAIGLPFFRGNTDSTPAPTNGAYFAPSYFGGRYFGRRYFG